jgi:lipoprotein-releasing system ATP-binding protein
MSELLNELVGKQMGEVVSAVKVSKRFTEGRLDVTVLREVSLSVAAGETVAVVGASGSGKSTLLHILGGLDKASSGEASLCGSNWASMGGTAQSQWRNQHLGFIYQFHHLLPEFSALDNVAMPLWIRRQDKASANEQAAAMLRKVGLGERLHHRPSELSGGERQRVAVARALVTQPACVLADEPTGNLDRSAAQNVFELMRDLAAQQQTALVVVTHDATLAQQCQRQYALVGGVLSST